MNQNKSKTPLQTSALLMVSPQDVGLLGVSEGNLPTLLAVPASASDNKLLLTDIGDVDNFVGQSSASSSPQNVLNNSATKETLKPASLGTWFGNPLASSLPPSTNPTPNSAAYSQFSAPNTSANNFSNLYGAQTSNDLSRPPLPPSSSFVPPLPPVSASAAIKGNQYRNTSKFQRVFDTDCLSSHQQQQHPQFQQNFYPQQQPFPSEPSIHPNSFQPHSTDNQVALSGALPTPHPYQPIQPHWFYSSGDHKSPTWYPFSHLDSQKLEEALLQAPDSMVSVVGGRFVVDLNLRRRGSVYWDEEGEVRRALWFKVEGAGLEDGMKLIPCDETFAAGLEEAYKNTLLTSDFHKQLAFQTGETVVIHTPSTIICHPPSDAQHAWANNLTGENKTQVLKRGVEDVENIPKDECENIDHVVLVVQACKQTSSQAVISNVDAFRDTSREITAHHFSRGNQGRVEFLPVLWSYQTLQEEVQAVERSLKSTTLTGVSKMRHFSNDLLLDLCFFLSPTHAQKAATSLANSLNEAFSKFKARNQSYQGGVSIMAHSIGNLLVYELLSKQHDSPQGSATTSPQQQPLQQPLAQQPAATTQLRRNNTNDSLSSINSAFNEVTGATLEEVFRRLDLKDFEGVFKQEHIDSSSLLLLEDADLKDLGLPLGPRKKLKGYIKHQKEQFHSTLKPDDTAQQPAQHENSGNSNNVSNNNNTQGVESTSIFTFECGRGAGVDKQVINYPRLNFQVANLFTLGSPIAFYLSLTGVSGLGDDFQLPTCPAFFNIFHPFDSLAYRMEPLITSSYPPRPVLIPHHKGRKRMHLELKESLARIGQDLKQRIMDSVRSTWKSIHSFAQAHKTSSAPQASSPAEVDEDVSNVLVQLQKDADDAGSVMASSMADECDSLIARLNQGRRVDYVLQEKPIEIFNDYMFALSSPSSYWRSEDTALMVLKEIYLLQGIFSHKPYSSSSSSKLPIGPPPVSGFVKPPSDSFVSHTPPSHVSFHQHPPPSSLSQPSLSQQQPLPNFYSSSNPNFLHSQPASNPPPPPPGNPPQAGYNQFSMQGHHQQLQQHQHQQMHPQQQMQQQQQIPFQSLQQHPFPTNMASPPFPTPQPPSHTIGPPPSSGFVKH